jgi:hypothetical protein
MKAHAEGLDCLVWCTPDGQLADQLGMNGTEMVVVDRTRAAEMKAFWKHRKDAQNAKHAAAFE